MQALVDIMRQSGAADSAIASFCFHLHRLLEGESGILEEEEINPVPTLVDAENFAGYRAKGLAAIPRTAIIKLNGGLGTSMGLDSAKSLLPVRDGLSFLDLIAHQVLALREELGAEVPLLLMNSFRTAAGCDETLAAYPEVLRNDLPTGFLQNRVPKILADGFGAAVNPSDEDLAWCPPGHGDLYTAIAASGTLDRLLERGIEYAFVSNADNLGAALDPSLLGFMVAEGHDFMLEAADRTAADRKGGHLCRLEDGRLALRESAQCPPAAADAFQDVRRYRYFNTNNLWLHLPSLARLLDEHGGFLPLPTVVNRKTLDPRNPASPAVIQLETVMGTAMSLFPHATAVRVSRRRFSPVKNTNDLLAVRSDAFELKADARLVLSHERTDPPVIRLDARYYALIDDFEDRFPHGPPSLRRCASLTVEGDVTFGADVEIIGQAVVRAKWPSVVPDGTVIRGEFVAPSR
jgi:UTP--glucose-1-phosphate uridylyltransferase